MKKTFLSLCLVLLTAISAAGFYGPHIISMGGVGALDYINSLGTVAIWDAKNDSASADAWEDYTANDVDLAQDTADNQPTANADNRDFDGTNDYLHQEIIGDETGVTEWRLITTDGSATLRAVGVDLSAYAGTAGSDTPYMVVLTDSAGKKKWGYIAEADSAEALGTDVLSGWDLSSGWTYTNGTNVDADTFTTDANGSVFLDKTPTATIGKLYKAAFTGSTTAGTLRFTGASSNPIYAVSGQSAVYSTAINANAFIQNIGSTAGATTDITTMALEEVTALGTDAVTVVSTKNGSTQNWNGDADFNPNDASITMEIRRSDLQITGDMSIVLVLQPDDGQPAAIDTPASKWIDSAGNMSWLIYALTDGTYRLYIGDGSDLGDYETTDATVFANGAAASPKMVDFVYTSGGSASITIGVNGSAVASSTAGTIPATVNDADSPVVIGTTGSHGLPYGGKVQHVSIFNKALSSTERTAIYNKLKGRYGL